VSIHFWKVALKPGKPVAFGTWGEGGEKIFFGIPGNPVASMVVYEILVKPAIKKMMGYQNPENKIFTGILTEDFKRKSADRLEFIRAYVEYKEDNFYVKPFTKQASNMLTSMVNANALVFVDKDIHQIEAGEKVRFIFFDREI
jgi:Molybdopterin biosynthesis enzyme